MADTGTGMRIGWFGPEHLAVSFSKGLQIILFTMRGDCLGAGAKTGTGTEVASVSGTGSLAEVTGEDGAAIAFSIRLCTLEGSMTCWLSSGGGVGLISLL